MSWYTRCLNKKFIFCDNFPNCKPIQIIFDRNIAEKIWNKLTHDNFDIYSLCVAIEHRKMTPIFSQFHNRYTRCSNVAFQAVCDDDTVIEVVFFSLWIISVINFTWFHVLFWLIYLLTYSNTERALPGIADDGLMSIVWCKHGFRRRRSNFDEKFVRFKDCGTKLHITEFLNKGWGLRGLYKLLKKAARNWHDGYRWSGNIESIQNISCFSVL